MKLELKIFDEKTFKVQPWKNGGGVTKELLRKDGDEGQFIYRMSEAIIEQEGPFSSFNGYMRSLVVLDGVVELHHDEASATKLEKGDTYKFQGAWKTHCKLPLKKASKDFNLIYKPNLLHAQVGSILLKNNMNLRINGDIDFLFCSEGSFEISSTDDKFNLGMVKAESLCQLTPKSLNPQVSLHKMSKEDVFLVHISLKYRENDV